MKDLEILLENKPGSLALLGETLGKIISALKAAEYFRMEAIPSLIFWWKMPKKQKIFCKFVGIKVLKINEVLIQKLRQDVPGQLGMFCRRLADAGINILVQYSDHANQLIVVVDDIEKGKLVSEQWMREWWLGNE